MVANKPVASAARRIMIGLGIVALAVAVAAPATSAAGVKTKLTSKRNGGGQADRDSHSPEVSANGRFVVFSSDATNIVATDTNGARDVFVHDRKKNKTKRISRGKGGAQADNDSYDPSISADGRFVLFASIATNLVTGDGNAKSDVFLFDRRTGKTKRISVTSAGVEGGNGSWNGSISADNRFVAFSSSAKNLVSGDSNDENDVFVRDLRKGKTKRISIGSDGTQGNLESHDPHISANGRFVVFVSDADNLVKGDTNDVEDIFVHDRKKGKTKRVSLKSNGVQANLASWDPVISATGRFIAFETEATNLRKNDDGIGDDIFVHDRSTRKTKLASLSSKGKYGDEDSSNPSISANGRWVVFESDAKNLVKNDTNGATDVFMRDRGTGKTRRISIRSKFKQGNSASDDAWVSADGRWVVFESDADNLVRADNNGDQDVFTRGRVN